MIMETNKKDSFNPGEPETLPSFYTQVCEELVRQIHQAQRWCAVEEATMALMKVRRMAEQHQREQRHINGTSNYGTDLKRREANVV
jgi:hypothetical protein